MNGGMLKVFAALVIGFFALLWVTGNTPASFKDNLNHWAEGSGTGSASDDWGS